MIPTYLQDQTWLLCHACGHVAYAGRTDPTNPRPNGRPRAGDRCPQCAAHGPQHRGRLLLVTAHLEEAS